MCFPLLIDDEALLPRIPRLLADGDAEFCLSRRLDASMVSACCRAGYLPMAGEMAGEGDLHPLLLIKCHRERMLLAFKNLHVSRSTARRIRREAMWISFDQRFEQTLHEVDRFHRSSWLTAPYRDVLRELHHDYSYGVSVHSVELVSADGVLVAGEVGYRCGGVYTSLSGFYARSGAGSVQTVSLAHVLADRGFRFWDLGMDIPYKRALGARAVPREAFLRAYQRAAAAPSPTFPKEPLSCRVLYGPDGRARE